jgi:hypothetical protein
MNDNSLIINDSFNEKLISLKKNNDALVICLENTKEINYNTIGKTSDDVSVVDISTMVIFGLIGAVVTNNEALKHFLDDIHSDSSLSKPKTLLGNVLHHKGDVIDHVTRKETFAPYLHRLFGGHDILSFKGDNPINLLTKQYGIMGGIIQAIRHLTSDTFSKEGLALPGSSFLDFTRDGKISNHLAEWAQCSSRGTNLTPVEAYSELFTIKMQDIGATTVTIALAKLYAKNAKIESEIAICQLKIIALLTNVVVSAVWGAIKHGGIPKISIPAITTLIKEVIAFFVLNYKELKELENKTSVLIQKGDILQAEVYATGKDLYSYDDSFEYIKELERGQKNFDQLTAVFNI